MRSVIAPLEEHIIQTPTQQATHKHIKCKIDHPFRRQMAAFGFQAEQPYTHQQRGHIHQAIETQRKWTNPEHNWMHSALSSPQGRLAYPSTTASTFCAPLSPLFLSSSTACRCWTRVATALCSSIADRLNQCTCAILRNHVSWRLAR